MNHQPGSPIRPLLRLLLHAALLAAACCWGPLLAQEEPLQITDVRVSNHLGNAFVVSWRTNRPTFQNQVLYGKDPLNLTATARDTLAAPGVIHYAQLVYLDINASYYLRVRSDGVESALDTVLTFPQQLPQNILLLLGQVTDQGGSPMPGVLVRAWAKWWRDTNSGIDSTMWFSVLTNSNGDFSIDYYNFRRYNGSRPAYFQNQTMLYLEILGESQGARRDSVLLTAASGDNYYSIGAFELIDERKDSLQARVTASSPVLADGIAASLVEVTMLDAQQRPIPNVEVGVLASPDRGVSYRQPQYKTNALGKTWALVFSTVAEEKTIRAINITADSTMMDSFAVASFVAPPGDPSQDRTPPYIYYVSQHPDTQDNINPYQITARAIDNFPLQVKLVWSSTGYTYTDTLLMQRVGLTDEYRASIPAQPYSVVIRYFVLAQDAGGMRVSKPDSITSNPYILPYRFEIVPPSSTGAPKLGITNTLDATSTRDAVRPVRVDTWITATHGVRQAVVKWRNVSHSQTFFDAQLEHYGAHWWGVVPAQPEGSRVEYFIQVTDSLGQVERDRRRAPFTDLFNYEVFKRDSLAAPTFADTTAVLGTADAFTTRMAALGDFNADGYLDVVAANYGQPNRLYIFSPGPGILQDVTAETFSTQYSDKSTCLAAADFDADDDLDLVVANEGEQSRLYLNNGLGRFEDVTLLTFGGTGQARMPSANWNSVCVLAEDFDGDGDIDLFFANNAPGGEQNKLLFNDSLGVFRDQTILYLGNPAPDQSVWALSGDVDNDGKLDIVVINRAQSHVLFRNTGRGVFRQTLIATESAPRPAAATWWMWTGMATWTW